MKRILTILALLALTCITTMQAQVLKKSNNAHATEAASRRAAINAGENQQWWGYITGADKLTTVGVGVADTYHCAIFLPGNHDIAGGKTIHAVRFFLSAANVSNVKVWIANTLPSGNPTASNTVWMKTVPTDELEDATDVALDTPYALPEKGVYVGYSFTITAAASANDQYPVYVGGNDEPYALLLRTANSMPQWSDLNGQGFGALALQVLLEGDFAENMVSPVIQQSGYYAQVGESADVTITLKNNGREAMNNFSYTITSDGVTTDEQTFTLPSAIAPFTQGNATISVNADATARSSVKTLTVTKVNGQPNASANASADFTLFTMDRLIKRNVVVEEFTGTGCGWCPRGLVGMENLRQTFGDRFIGIGIHQYNNSDAMYLAAYPNLGWQGAPSCMIDRGPSIDPYYGTNQDIRDDFRQEMNVPAMVEVSVSGVMNSADTEVEATARVTPLFDTDEYSLELALVADGLSGTTTAWTQSNYYYSSSSSQVPDDLRIFASGGKYGKSGFTGWVFNDVAISTSYVSGKNGIPNLGAIAGGETREVSYTLKMPTKATMRNALKKGTVYVVALVVGKDGRIANAAKRKVGDLDAVHALQSDNASATTRYSLNGTPLTTPQRGLNIVRQADGTVHKVMVK